jgi:Flp pilus assembly protein TadD
MNKAIKVAASTIVLGSTLVGCQPATKMYRPVAASAAEQKADTLAAKSYQRAQVELEKGKLPEALAAMERAVELSPRDAGYRMGLAELYMKSGRFASAETTLGDVLALDPENVKAGIRLALSQLAQGRIMAATAQLRTLEGRASASDLGLAYALAGDTRHALELLEPAARAADATGRVRQNLALAYALAGDWKKSRITAEQDVSPTQINERMAQWAAVANPTGGLTRVTAIMGITPVEDGGQPSRLALAPAVAVTEAYAAAEPESQPAFESAVASPIEAAPAEPVRLASVEAGPAQVATISEVPAAPLEPLPAEPVVVEQQHVVAAQALVETPAVQPAAADSRLASIRSYVASRFDTPVLKPRSARKTGRSRYVVQLGAYTTAASVERAWAQAVRRNGTLRSFEPMSTTVRVNGQKILHRLSMAGFESQSSAVRACQSIRGRGGACFVRSIAGDAPVQWASRYARKA